MSLSKQIYKASHITGSFKLKSGLETTEYFDKYLFESDPKLIHDICLELADLIPEDTEFLAGLEMGGIPIATILAHQQYLPLVFVRKHQKKYGTCKQVEGPSIEGIRITIIEDVVTTGSAIVEAVEAIRNMGGIVNTALCVIDREQGGTENLERIDISLISLYSMKRLDESTKKVRYAHR